MKIIERAPFKNRIRAILERNTKDIWQDDVSNLVVNDGKDLILNVMFASGTASTTWYIGLINNSPAPSLLATNDMTTGSRNWDELYSQYSETNRPTWGTATTTSQSMTNATTANFTFTSSATVYGIFITDSNTKNGVTGTMWAAGAFSSPRSVINGDVLKITYTVSL